MQINESCYAVSLMLRMKPQDNILAAKNEIKAQSFGCEKNEFKINQNHRLSRWYAPRLQGVCTGSPIRALNDSPIATVLQASAKVVFFMPYYSCYP